jgi:hypothetical protein
MARRGRPARRGEGFNVNRRGALFVPAVEGRDIAMLALRLAETAGTVYLALLELGELHQWVGRFERSMLSPRCPPCVT